MRRRTAVESTEIQMKLGVSGRHAGQQDDGMTARPVHSRRRVHERRRQARFDRECDNVELT